MLKNSIKSIARKLVCPRPSGGDSPYEMFARHTDAKAKLTIIDCGAHLGHTALQAAALFPQATVYALEAAPRTFAQMRNNVSSCSRIIPVHAAVGNATAKNSVTIHIVRGKDGTASDNHIESAGRDYSHLPDGETALVDGIRIDDFCKERDIPYVDYLKIDVEGHEMPALEGAVKLLEARRIGFIELELGISSMNKFHTPYTEAWPFLTKYGYDAIGFFGMVPDFVRKEPFIRRANVLFMKRDKE